MNRHEFFWKVEDALDYLVDREMNYNPETDTTSLFDLIKVMEAKDFLEEVYKENANEQVDQEVGRRYREQVERKRQYENTMKAAPQWVRDVFEGNHPTED